MATFNRIDKLRFFRVLRPHIGEDDAEEFADALQEEFSPLATKADLEALHEAIRETIRAEIALAVNSMMFRFTALWAALLAAAVIILRFT